MKVLLESKHEDLGTQYATFEIKLRVLIGAKHITTREEILAILAQARQDIENDMSTFIV